MTVVNPKSISGINSITTGSGSDDLLTIHTNNGTERLRVDSTGATKIVTGIVTTLTATTGIVTTLTANTVTSLGDVDIADKIVHTGDTDTAIRFSGADTITAETAGSARLRINSSGQIQIGGSTLINSDPLLTLGQSASTVGNQFHLVNDGSADLKQIFIAAGKSSRHVGVDVSTNNFFVGRDNVDSDLVIASDGDIGIGTITAQNNARLQVSTSNQVVATFEGTGVSDPQIYLGDDMTTPTDNCIILGYDKADNRGYLTVGGDGDNVFTVKNGGDIEIGVGNLKIGASGKGIDFSAAADETTNLAETVDASILDDYEEGQFTPAVQFDSGGGGISYGTRYGRYRKIGNMVSITYYMEISSGVSSSDYFARLSLPFNGFGGSVGHQDARIRQWNTGYSDWFVSLGGSAPVFFHSNANGSSSNYARGDDINGYKLSGQVILYT